MKKHEYDLLDEKTKFKLAKQGWKRLNKIVDQHSYTHISDRKATRLWHKILEIWES